MTKKFVQFAFNAICAALFVSACQLVPLISVPTQTSLPTITLTPSLASSPTYTPTPSPTFTPTTTPTVVGGIEPKIAFIAKDSLGKINLYIDGLYTGQPKIISKILLPEAEASLQMKWSPDGRKLVFTNRDENQELWLFVYDVFENNFQKIYKIPAGRYVDTIKWSPNSNTLTISTANATCCDPGLAHFQINLTDGTLERVQGDGFWINNVTRVNNQAVCYDYRNPIIRRMLSAGYDGICYFPEIGLYGGIKRGENGVDYDLLSEDGQVQKTLCKFPVGLETNGAINLLLSPDKSRVLIIGEVNGGNQFSIPISMKDTSIENPNPELFILDLEPLYRETPPPHVVMSKDVFGWLPDSRSYAEARFFFDGYNSANFTGQGEFVVIDADSGTIEFSYNFQSNLQPMILALSYGYDIVWPK